MPTYEEYMTKKIRILMSITNYCLSCTSLHLRCYQIYSGTIQYYGIRCNKLRYDKSIGQLLL